MWLNKYFERFSEKEEKEKIKKGKKITEKSSIFHD